MSCRVVLIFCMCVAAIAGCAPRVDSFAGNDTNERAARLGLDYRRVVDGAMRGERRSLHDLFWLTANAGFDGASSQANATMLATLLRHVGDGIFGEALHAEPDATAGDVRDQLRYGFGVGEAAGVTEESLAHRYPITFGTPRPN